MTAIDMNFSLILPEIALALFAMAALMLGAFFGKDRLAGTVLWLSVAALLLAVVASPPAMSEPCSGSVRQNTPVISKDVIFGSHAANCSGVPPTRQAVRNSPAWAV